MPDLQDSIVSRLIERLPNADFLWDENIALRERLKKTLSALKDTQERLDHFVNQNKKLSLELAKRDAANASTCLHLS